jgi:hypothetical protein
MKRFFARFKYSRLLLSFLFVFVGPVEHCGLEDFSSPWHARASKHLKKRKTKEKF